MYKKRLLLNWLAMFFSRLFLVIHVYIDDSYLQELVEVNQYAHAIY